MRLPRPLLLLLLAPSLLSALPSFPGAQGFGSTATGGRGGEVYHVTSLEDSGPGSLREGVSKGQRTIVFDVGGYIDLKSPLQIASDITIAGQTAPGEGIGTKNYQVGVSKAKNVIIRFMRFRQGLTPGQEKKYTFASYGAERIILDHCSIEWGRWDCIGMSKAKDITLQDCMIGESIDPQRFGCLCESDNVSFIRNLWLNNQSRNPKAKGRIQYVNNVVYNWGVSGLVGGHSGADHYLDMVGNYFVKGPNSNDTFVGGFTSTDKVYQKDNYADLDRDGSLNGRLAREEDFGKAPEAPVFLSAPTLPTDYPVLPASEVWGKVLAEAGCSLVRDAHDKRLITDVASLGKAGKIIKDHAWVGGFGSIQGGTAPQDSDGDGMPDAWEKARKLNPEKADNNGLELGGGYTNLEHYLAEKARRGMESP